MNTAHICKYNLLCFANKCRVPMWLIDLKQQKRKEKNELKLKLKAQLIVFKKQYKGIENTCFILSLTSHTPIPTILLLMVFPPFSFLRQGSETKFLYAA